MGAFADEVVAHLRDRLADRCPAFSWETEYRVGGTPADVVGRADDRLVAVELEWRRADPADNTAKLFRHLASGALDTERVLVFQVFTRHYDLASGGVASKRENAEFVGRIAADSIETLTYHPITFDLDPPTRGGDRPPGWQAVADEVVGAVVGTIAERR